VEHLLERIETLEQEVNALNDRLAPIPAEAAEATGNPDLGGDATTKKAPGRVLSRFTT